MRSDASLRSIEESAADDILEEGASSDSNLNEPSDGLMLGCTGASNFGTKFAQASVHTAQSNKQREALALSCTQTRIADDSVDLADYPGQLLYHFLCHNNTAPLLLPTTVVASNSFLKLSVVEKTTVVREFELL